MKSLIQFSFATRCACQMCVHMYVCVAYEWVCVWVYVFECVTRVPYSRGFTVQCVYIVAVVTVHLPTHTNANTDSQIHKHERTHVCMCIWVRTVLPSHMYVFVIVVVATTSAAAAAAVVHASFHEFIVLVRFVVIVIVI